jgi:hypothetical protein
VVWNGAGKGSQAASTQFEVSDVSCFSEEGCGDEINIDSFRKIAIIAVDGKFGNLGRAG